MRETVGVAVAVVDPVTATLRDAVVVAVVDSVASTLRDAVALLWSKDVDCDKECVIDEWVKPISRANPINNAKTRQRILPVVPIFFLLAFEKDAFFPFEIEKSFMTTFPYLTYFFFLHLTFEFLDNTTQPTYGIWTLLFSRSVGRPKALASCY